MTFDLPNLTQNPTLEPKDDTFSPFEDVPLKTLVTHILGGRVTLEQPQKGYRIGMDGALLAAFASHFAQKAKTVLELGCGVGGVALSLKSRRPNLNITGLERDPIALALAQKNSLLNKAENIVFLHADIAKPFSTQGLERFDMVLSNPPFFDDEAAMRPVHSSKRGAWIADDGLQAWLDFAQTAVKDKGTIVFIHRADRLLDILRGLEPKCGAFEILPIHPFAHSKAKRVLIKVTRLGKAPLVLHPPLILHDEAIRKHRPEIEAVLRGDTLIFDHKTVQKI